MTPGVIRELGIFAGLALLAGACWFVAWRRRAAGRASLATQRAIAHRAGLDTYTPQSKDRHWDDWAAHHRGGL